MLQLEEGHTIVESGAILGFELTLSDKRLDAVGRGLQKAQSINYIAISIIYEFAILS
jgi:hypothetical protein